MRANPRLHHSCCSTASCDKSLWCAWAAAVAYYNSDYYGYAQYGTNIAIALRTAANNNTAGGSVCGASLYPAPRLRNIVYCPSTSGVNFVRIERTSADYLRVSEIEVFRGGEAGSCLTGSIVMVPHANCICGRLHRAVAYVHPQ